jgi:hypothetical protein
MDIAEDALDELRQACGHPSVDLRVTSKEGLGVYSNAPARR